MRPEIYCHLPFLSMEGTPSVEIEDAFTITALPVDEWLSIEDPVMAYHTERYAEVSPVFVRSLLPDGHQIGRLSTEQECAAEDFLDRAHAATILAMPKFLAVPPALSTSYVVWRGTPFDTPREDGWFGPDIDESDVTAQEEGIHLGRVTVWLQQAPPGGGKREQWVVERRFGPAQREWLLSRGNLPPTLMCSEDANRFASSFQRLVDADWGRQHYDALQFVDVLTALFTPGTPIQEAVVLLVSSLENLVNPDADGPLGRTFATRCAAWFAENEQQRQSDEKVFRILYEARSSILHGNDATRGMRRLVQATDISSADDLYGWIRLLAWLATDWLTAWYSRVRSGDASRSQFRAALVRSADLDENGWIAARGELVQGRTHARG